MYMHMENPCTLGFTVSSTNSAVPLGLKVIFDKSVIYTTTHMDADVQIEHQFSDVCGEHELLLELFGKKSEHTKIDATGQILSDVLLTCTDVQIDGVPLDPYMRILAEYCHDHNGTQPMKSHNFSGAMGCNGLVSFKFRTPVYLWELEYN